METNLKDIAAELIYSSGGEDIEFLTIIETLQDQLEEEGIDIEPEEVDVLANTLSDLITKATVRVSWVGDETEYVFGVDDEDAEGEV